MTEQKFYIIPAPDYEALQARLARIERLLEARHQPQPQPVRLDKWAEGAGITPAQARGMARRGDMPPGCQAVKAGGRWWVKKV